MVLAPKCVGKIVFYYKLIKKINTVSYTHLDVYKRQKESVMVLYRFDEEWKKQWKSIQDKAVHNTFEKTQTKRLRNYVQKEMKQIQHTGVYYMFLHLA